MLKYLLLYCGGLALAWALTPVVRTLAIRFKALDMPDARKVHRQPTPRLGGVAIFVAFNLMVLLAFSPWRLVSNPFLVVGRHWWTGFLAASSIIVALGVVDDLRPLGARVKLLTQILAATVAVTFGYVIDHVTLPGGTTVQFGWWSVPLTILWIVGLTNAFNLIDGLDGLASGVAFFASLTLLGIGLLHGQVELALLCAILAGCLLGFLRYNSHPASIFLGDSGSLFLGFTMAVLGISTSHLSSTAASILVPLLAFGLPLADTLLAMLRRLLRAAHVVEATETGKYRFFYLRGRGVFEADRDHIHHRLLRLGINQPSAVFLLYVICAAMGLVAVALVSVRNPNTGLVVVVLGSAAVVAIRKLRYEELAVLRNGTLLPFSHLRVLGYTPFQVGVDVGLVALAYYLAHLVRFEGHFQGVIKAHFVATLPVILLAKLIAFRLAGLYRIRWQHAGLPDVIRGLRAMLWGAAAAVAVLVCWRARVWWGVVVIDFFVMTFGLLGARCSVRLLEYYARSNPGHKRRALIYGAGAAGSSLAHLLLAGQSAALTPVGFIDDDPGQQHKTLYGYPVFGSSAVLPEVLRTADVQELVVAAREITPEHLEHLRICCRDTGVKLRRFQVQLEDVLPEAPATGRKPVAAGVREATSPA